MTLFVGVIIGFVVSILGVAVYVHTLSKVKGMTSVVGYSVFLSAVTGTAFISGVLYLMSAMVLYFIISGGMEVSVFSKEEFKNGI